MNLQPIVADLGRLRLDAGDLVMIEGGDAFMFLRWDYTDLAAHKAVGLRTSDGAIELFNEFQQGMVLARTARALG